MSSNDDRIAPAQIDAARAALGKIFERADPYETGFRESVAGRAVIFPTHIRQLSEQQFRAVAAAASEIFGEQRAYHAVIEGDTSLESGPSRAEAYLLDLSDADKYAANRLGDTSIDHRQNALFSVDGNWGILQSYEEHALLGSSPEFVAACFDRLSESVEEMAGEWVLQWAENAKLGYGVAWVLPLARHVFGDDLAESVVMRSVPDELKDLLLNPRPTTLAWTEADVLEFAEKLAKRTKRFRRDG